MGEYLFSSESVTEGHPDKIADQISDSVLDAVLADDPFGRVACETFTTTGLVIVGGEITTTTYVPIADIVRQVVKDIGYTSSHYGFDWETCAVLVTIDKQSPDIAKGVDRAGAGDQGMMFGYAVDETPELMPLPIVLAHKLTYRLAEVRKSKLIDYLRPDGKAQVSIRYIDGKPAEVTAVVVSSQHDEGIPYQKIKSDIIEKVVEYVIPEEMRAKNIQYYINPTGSFVIGGPQGDAGLTGRKIVVDTYGGSAPHGGGSFSGKDPTKVDRSAAYAARHVAKNVVASGLARKCLIQVAYAIGIDKPVSFMVDTFHTGVMPDEEISKLISNVFDMTPAGIIERLDLRRPIYRKTATYGHFGRELPEFTWEKRDYVEKLKRG